MKKKKKETRGRKAKILAPIRASFGDVIDALADSTYKPKKVLKKRRGKK